MVSRTHGIVLLAVVLAIVQSAVAQWQPHVVRQINMTAGGITELPAQYQVVTESWNDIVRHPTIVYMPDKERLLLLASRGTRPLYSVFVSSDDGGNTWTEPRWAHTDRDGHPDIKLGLTLNYLGSGKCILGDAKRRWFSTDHGVTWGNPVVSPPVPSGDPFGQWHSDLIDRDPQTGQVIRMVATGNSHEGEKWPKGTTVAFIRFSKDEGQTWSECIRVPQWHGFSEISLVRAQNGDLVASCRRFPPAWYGGDFDNFAGMGVCISKDNGLTWSDMKMVYTFGRHHASMVLMPNGDIVMVYVVRLGYPADEDGFPQFGIEAILSYDNGQTWDMNRRIILAKWSSPVKGHEWQEGVFNGLGSFRAAPQTTSTILMPDGWLLTTFGFGERASEPFPNKVWGPYDIGLVRWRPPSR